jgi:hypothetical protein
MVPVHIKGPCIFVTFFCVSVPLRFVFEVWIVAVSPDGMLLSDGLIRFFID